MMDFKKTPIITLHKAMGKVHKNCIYAKNANDVPSFLLDDWAVEINDKNSIILHAVECPATRPFPVFICYEKVSEENADKVPGNYGAWPKDNGATTLKVVDGKCYNLPATVTASLITEEVPEWVTAAGFPVKRNGSTYELTRTDWGGEVRVGRIGKALWMNYSNKDVNILDLSEESASQYIVTENGVDIGSLTEIFSNLI